MKFVFGQIISAVKIEKENHEIIGKFKRFFFKHKNRRWRRAQISKISLAYISHVTGEEVLTANHALIK